MKPLLLALALFCSLSLAQADEAPTLKAADAAAIAQGDLAPGTRVLDLHRRIDLQERQTALGGDPAHWEVMWSKEFDAQTEGRKEIGLKIKMDGTYTRSVR